MSLNKVMVIGHLGQDPEIRYTPTGLPVVNFSVATDEAYLDKAGKRQERVEWHRVVVVGKLEKVDMADATDSSSLAETEIPF
jgi:single-strand DNA-binding protein